jgi:YebC/PmpR family DNA-binding regulatory protein
MAGHSKWAKIHRGKAIEDAKRGAVFTKLGNGIALAARNGEDPDLNFSLRLAIDKAKQANMPANNIQRAIDRGSGKLGGDQIQEVMYEGYGPGGSAILVECATDNINRTYPAVRLAFTKHGGNTAEKGAVAFQFTRKGVITVKGTGEQQLLTILDSGAEDAEEEDGETTIYTDSKELARVRDNLKNAGMEILEAEISYVPDTLVKIEDKAAAGKVLRLMDALDNLDDVSKTHVNFDIPKEFLS